jgi:hypothetical protein
MGEEIPDFPAEMVVLEGCDYRTALTGSTSLGILRKDILRMRQAHYACMAKASLSQLEMNRRLNFVELGIFARWQTSYGHTLYAWQNAWQSETHKHDRVEIHERVKIRELASGIQRTNA